MIKISIAPKPNMVLRPYDVANRTEWEEVISIRYSLLFTEPSHIHRASLGFNVIPVWVGSVPQAVQPVRLVAEPVWLEVDSRLVEVVARGSLRIHPEG
jgi:hypothetical protein